MRDNSKNLFTLSIIVLVVTALAFLTNTFTIILLLESLKDLKVEGNVDQNQVRAILKTVFIIAYVVESLINSGDLRVRKQHLVPVESVKFLRLSHIEGMA